MPGVPNDIQDNIQRHPLVAYSIATGLIIFSSAALLHIGGRPFVHTPGFADLLSLRYYLQPSGDHHATAFESWQLFVQRLQTEVCNLNDHAAKAFLQIGERTREIRLVFIALADRLTTEAGHLLDHPWIARIPIFQVLTVLALAAFVLLIRRFSGSWIARHRLAAAHFVHFAALASFVGQGFCSGDWLVAALVMVSFDVFHRALDGDATGNDESQHQSLAPSSAVETLLEQANTLLTESQIVDLPRRSLSWSQKGDPTSIIGPHDSKDRDIVRLQWSLTDLQTAIKAKDVELDLTKQELLNAKDALTKSVADISALQNDMRTMKNTLGKDNQSLVYRKDIELFALRKGNEQKERQMQEKDAQFSETFKQQRATLELKEAQLNVLKERLAAMERQASPRFSHDAIFEQTGNGDHALEVRLLRVKKGRRSLSGASGSTAEDDKDAIIEQLRRELSTATKSADDVVNQQAELQRAWEISKKIQNALKEERERHDQTKACLQEASAELEEVKQGRRRSRSDPSSGRLPTIEENDQNELEAMFDTAQQDNLRLHMEVETLDKRVRDANARIFLADQEIEALREKLRLEHAINEDMETARPSVVHRVHFQRMEGQLKESRDDATKKESEVQNLRLALAGKERQLEALRADMQVAVTKSESACSEIEQLKQSITELQAVRESLMQDHERLAAPGSRQRVSSADFTSARTSGATLINEHSPSPRLTSPGDAPPVPVAPMLGSPVLGSVQPRGHRRNQSDSQRHSLVGNDAMPDTRTTKRRSGLGLRDMVKRMVKKDTSIEGVLRSPTTAEDQWGNTTNTAVDNNALKPVPPPMRERRRSLTSHPPEQKQEVESMPRAIPRPISGPPNIANRPRTSTAPAASVPRRFPSRKELDEQHLQRPRTATQPVIGTQTAALPKAMRPPNPRRSSQPRYYTSPTAIAINSTEDLRLKDARPQAAVTAPLANVIKELDKQAKHDSGVGAIPEGEKSKLSRLSWGNTANKLKRRSIY